MFLYSLYKKYKKWRQRSSWLWSSPDNHSVRKKVRKWKKNRLTNLKFNKLTNKIKQAADLKASVLTACVWLTVCNHAFVCVCLITRQVYRLQPILRLAGYWNLPIEPLTRAAPPGLVSVWPLLGPAQTDTRTSRISLSVVVATCCH